VGLHILVGDGVATNEAAAQLLWAWACKQRLHRRVDYLLWVVKCASHQTSLVASSVVAGRAATVGAASSQQLVDLAIVQKNIVLRSIAPHRNSCGAIVRFFKYLVSDYYSDFCANLRDLVGKLRLCEANNTHPERAVRWQGLETLYGAGVFPPGLLECLNCGVDSWTHCLDSHSAACAPAASRESAQRVGLERAQARLFDILRKRILVVDEHPTLSRMFTFHPHVECLLLLVFLGCLPDIVKSEDFSRW